MTNNYEPFLTVFFRKLMATSCRSANNVFSGTQVNCVAEARKEMRDSQRIDRFYYSATLRFSQRNSAIFFYPKYTQSPNLA